MAGVPALRSTAIRIPAVASVSNAAKGNSAQDIPASGMSAARAVEPISGAVEARPRDQSAALLLTLARDEAGGFGKADGHRARTTDQAFGTGPAARACLAYRLQGAEPEIYSDRPLIFRFHI